MREQRKWAEIVGCPQLKQSGSKKDTDGCVYIWMVVYIYNCARNMRSMEYYYDIAMEYYLDFSNA